MAKITRFTLKPFGGAGPLGDFGQFGSLASGSIVYSKDPAIIQALGAWDTGWAAETIANNRPALEDFNSIDYVYGQSLCYLFQAGIPEYDAGTNYYTNSFAQVNGVVYRSLSDANYNNNPTTSPTWWTTFIPSGSVSQVVNSQTGAASTGSVALPVDNTIPQNTEGTEFLTATITPRSALNKLKIEVNINISCASAVYCAIALFQDSIANALAANYGSRPTGNGENVPLTITYYMAAGTTSPTTFKVRGGSSSGAQVTLNGSGGSSLFGGVMISSITVTEIMA